MRPLTFAKKGANAESSFVTPAIAQADAQSDASERMTAAKHPFCAWKYDEHMGAYETACDQAYCSEGADDLTRSHYNFCPNCGKRIEVVKPEPEETE